MTRQFRLIGITLALAASCGFSQATLLPAESVTTSVDIVDGFFGGTLLNTAITEISNESYTGIARSAVYDTGTGLDFYYQFSNSIESVNGIERFSAYDFGSVNNTNVIDVFQTSAAFGVFVQGSEKSDYADRSNLGVIGFSFVPNGASKVTPGTTSYTQIIRTSARSYSEGHFGLLDGIGANAGGFEPAVVPEPSTATLILAGLGLMGLVARRRSARQAS